MGHAAEIQDEIHAAYPGSARRLKNVRRAFFPGGLVHTRNPLTMTNLPAEHAAGVVLVRCRYVSTGTRATRSTSAGLVSKGQSSASVLPERRRRGQARRVLQPHDCRSTQGTRGGRKHFPGCGKGITYIVAFGISATRMTMAWNEVLGVDSFAGMWAVQATSNMSSLQTLVDAISNDAECVLAERERRACVSFTWPRLQRLCIT